MRALRKGLRQALIVFRRIVMNRFFRTAVHPGIGVFIADNSLEFDASRPRALLFEDARTLPFRLQDTHAAGKYMVNV